MDLPYLLGTCAPEIHPVTMARVVQVESRGQPLAIGINGARLARQPRSLGEAVSTARALRRMGLDFDAGLGQINVRNWARLGLDEVSVFDPCRNLGAAQVLLRDCFSRAPSPSSQTALRQALSCYNAGNFRGGFVNGYVSRVVRAPAVLPSPASSTKEPS